MWYVVLPPEEVWSSLQLFSLPGLLVVRGCGTNFLSLVISVGCWFPYTGSDSSLSPQAVLQVAIIGQSRHFRGFNLVFIIYTCTYFQLHES